VFELRQENRFPRPIDVEPMRLIHFPLAIDILAVSQIDKSRSMELVVDPMRDVEGQIIIYQDA